MVADGASVVLAGHTHGGQLAVPGWGALVTNCDLDTRRAKGVSRWWPGAGRTGPRAGAAPSSQAPSGCRVAARLGRAGHLALRPRARSPAGPRRPCSPWSRATPDRRASGVPATRLVRAGPISAGRGGSAILGCRRAPGSAAQPRGVAQLGSARRSGRRGRRFKSCHPDSRIGPLTCRDVGQGPSSCSIRAPYVQQPLATGGAGSRPRTSGPPSGSALAQRDWCDMTGAGRAAHVSAVQRPVSVVSK